MSVDDYTALAEASSSFLYLDTVNNVQYGFSAANATYTVSVGYTGTDIYDSTTATTYSFTDGQTAQDTSELIDFMDTNLQIKRANAQLQHKIHMEFYTASGDFVNNYKDVELRIRNKDYGDGTHYDHLTGVLERDDNNQLRFKFEVDMVPTQLTDTLEMIVYAKDKTTNAQYQSPIKETSVTTYLYNRLNGIQNSTDERDILLRSTIVDLLNYGASLQNLGNYRTNSLANTKLKADYPDADAYSHSDFTATDQIGYITDIENPVMRFTSHDLLFDDSINPILYFSATQNGREMNDTDYLEVIMYGESLKYYKSDMIIDAQRQRYQFTFTELTSNQVDTELTMTLRDENGNALSNTLHYTVSSNLPRRAEKAIQNGTCSTVEEFYNSVTGEALVYTIKFGRSARALGEYQLSHQ